MPRNLSYEIGLSRSILLRYLILRFPSLPLSYITTWTEGTPASRILLGTVSSMTGGLKYLPPSGFVRLDKVYDAGGAFFPPFERERN